MWFIDLLKELHKQGATAMGFAALAIAAVAYHQFISFPAVDARMTGQEKQVTNIRETQLETKLEGAYAALCMNPGAQDLLERIRDLQAQYQEVTQHRYDPPNCSLLLKIK